MESGRGPRTSVVIPTSRPGEGVEACLAALERGTVDDFEAIVVDSSATGEAQGTLAGLPHARVLRPEAPLPPHEARNLGAERARGQTIAFTDADCVPRPDWLERLLEAHERGSALVGGAIDPDGGGLVERGADICKFAPWLEGLRAGERHTLPTANLSLSRAAWERIGPFRVLAWSGDTELCRRAHEAGLGLRFEPRAVVRHDDPVRLRRFLRERRERGSAYAALRVAIESWSRPRAAAYAAAAPLLAGWLGLRGVLATVRSGRPTAALLTLPVTAAGVAAWALGEAGSYVRHAAGGTPPAT